MDTQELDSKAERIARYKAERRRQLAEKYGLSIDSDVDSEYLSKYTRARKEQDGVEKRVPKSEARENEGKDYGSLYSVRNEHKEMWINASESKEHSGQDRESSSEREKLHLNENQRKAPESSRHDLSSALENSTSVSFPGPDSSQTEVPSSPKLIRRVSLSSPKQLASPSHSLSDTRLG